MNERSNREVQDKAFVICENSTAKRSAKPTKKKATKATGG